MLYPGFLGSIPGVFALTQAFWSIPSAAALKQAFCSIPGRWEFLYEIVLGIRQIHSGF